MKLKMFRLIFKQQWVNVVLDCFVSWGTAITICCAYFNDGIELNKLKHIIVIVFLLFVGIAYIYRIYLIFAKWTHIGFPKDLFFDYISSQVNSAENNIKNIAGDLSWLKRQKDTYEKVRQKNVLVEIYFSQDNIVGNKETELLIEEYRALGIKMIPYPEGVKVKNIKGMLIDPDGNAKFFSFCKGDDDIINCTKYFSDSNEYRLAQSFINSVNRHIALEERYKESQSNRPVLIGVSGLNNIGKTTLCNKLKLKFGSSLVTIGDTFIGDVKISNFEVALFCLLNQLLEYNKILKENKDKTVFLFDRTPIDNFAFLLLHKSEEYRKYDRYIERIESELKNFMLAFKMVALLVPEGKRYKYKKTSNLSSQQRKKITNKIECLYHSLCANNYSKYKIAKYKDIKDFEKKMLEIVDDISQKIPL